MGSPLAQEISPVPASQDTAALRRVFEAMTPERCPRVYNFHMHTVCSDGRLTPELLIQQAVSIGLQGLAITDHHSVDGFRRAQAWLSGQQLPNAPHLWSGVEINAQLLHDEVHVLGYAIDPDHGEIAPYLQGYGLRGDRGDARHVIDAIHAAGGLAVLAHPARYRHSPAELIAAATELGIDGVETYYAYNNPNPWCPSPRQTREVFTLAECYGLLHSCGTDTHGLNLLQRL
ncbi:MULTISPECIES: PHP domain-containing protein [unclassified Leptolyngbya]|uniref:PHP domain-containing protein n=1 Tax=unclassified Leptolyngbya TaxID=2650499 RepID=UPI001684468B|nr:MULTISPECIES: PHP domain-containing protein [unclassified Leptolyngbya]MBD1913504.1 PHP domain-containing protein [Leptolyngbya sp. FACHB-8]MBD2153274.1 PHP domain-containing protein [Leptolyngbya sp. FACHB-16]